MQRMGVLRRGGLFALVGILGLAAVLGGCTADKKKAELSAQENAELRDKNAQLDQANRDLSTRLTELEARGNTPMDNGNEITPAGPSGKGRTARNTQREGNIIKMNDQGVPSAEIAGDVLFTPGSDVIKAEAKKTLDKVANEIKHTYARASIRVEGYTDSDPLVKTKQKWGTNEKLSQARAESVRKYLISKGIKSSQIESMGYGASKPKATKAQSRRVEILVIQ